VTGGSCGPANCIYPASLPGGCPALCTSPNTCCCTIIQDCM
jgi:hypothetical protein